MKSHERRYVEENVTNALEALEKNDFFLLRADVNERSVSHKLAEYLQAQFPGWHVDCEYNRDHDRKKQLTYPLPSEPIDSLRARTVFPDVIIHRRDTTDNLLVIEMKKDANSEGDEELKDKNKLQAFLTPPYSYQYGLFIAFDNVGHSRLEWFEPIRDCGTT
ncbi:MAG: hypothetical protein ACE5H0_11110 [Bacteroidota bacterium]